MKRQIGFFGKLILLVKFRINLNKQYKLIFNGKPLRLIKRKYFQHFLLIAISWPEKLKVTNKGAFL